MKKTLASFILFLLFPVIGWMQIWSVSPTSTAKNGTLTATAYDWEVIGVNPANLGWNNNHLLSFTALDAGLSGQSKGMNFPSFMTALHSSNLLSSSNNWQRILGTSGGMNATADINWAAVSFRLPKVPGAFAVNIRDRISSNGYLGPNASQALSISDNRVFNDATVLSLLDGTSLRYMHYREINLDYGSPLLNIGSTREDESPNIAKCFSFNKRNGNDENGGLALYGGVGIKYLMGLAYINGDVANGINATYSIADKYPGTLAAPGHGVAFDLGLGASWKRWKFGWSVTDIGSIKWKNTMTTSGDTNVAPITHGSDLIGQLKNGTLAGSRPAPDLITELPSKMRMGASYKLNSRFLFSADVIVPLNKTEYNLSSPYFALGAHANMYKYITLFAGLDYTNSYGVCLPIGATFNATRHMQFYLGTTDITSFVFKATNANVSAAVWMFRYNF
jgi:hypothetical protein